MEQQLSRLAKDVKDLKREEETIFEQSSRRDFGGHPMQDNQWGPGNFSSHARSYEHNSYDCYDGNIFGTRNVYNDTYCKRIPRNNVRNGGNYVNMDERFPKRKGDYEEYYDSYYYWGYNYRRTSQTLGVTSRPLSYNNLKLPLLCRTFCPYGYEAWEQKLHKCENRRRMGAQPIKTWNLMKQALRNRFGVGNHEGQRQGQSKVKFIELLKVEESPKVKELSKAKIEESLKIHVMEEISNEDPCCIMNEKSIEIKEKEKVE
ncbi:hypothetical protein M9H77_02919 [Catharanthus roseus]|uniref:Uncharacterized protein n=1 Tax=Catharanthus roseus TaxID=4058 RepID=A0ACC0C9T5_CATRO|nr:hypothetical protein M9H77_02919 [Catharanthus roseus]